MGSIFEPSRIAALLDERDRIEKELFELQLQELAKALLAEFDHIDTLDFMVYQQEVGFWTPWTYGVTGSGDTEPAHDYAYDLISDLDYSVKQELARRGHSPDKEDWVWGVEGDKPFVMDLREWADR